MTSWADVMAEHQRQEEEEAAQKALKMLDELKKSKADAESILQNAIDERLVNFLFEFYVIDFVLCFDFFDFWFGFLVRTKIKKIEKTNC